MFSENNHFGTPFFFENCTTTLKIHQLNILFSMCKRANIIVCPLVISNTA
nr:MAG TPA: hypothetical protein [Caudoviricetes sp.]